MWYVYSDKKLKISINTNKIWHMCTRNGETIVYIGKDEITLPGEKYFDNIMKASGKDVYRDIK